MIKKKRRIFIFSAIVMALFILAMNFRSIYSLKKLPPSEKWGKEVKIGTATANNNPKLIVEDDRVLTLYDDDEEGIATMSVLTLDGKVTKSVNYNINKDFPHNMMLVNSEDGYNIIYSYGNKSAGKYEIISVDRDLNEVDRKNEEGIETAYQIDNENILLGGSGKLTLSNTATGKATEIEDGYYENMISGAKCGDTIVVAYMDKTNALKAVEVKDNKCSEAVLLKQFGSSDSINYGNGVGSGSKDKASFIVDQYVKGELNTSITLTYDLNTKEITNGKVESDEYGNISKITRGISSDNNVFFGTVSRNLVGKKNQSDIVEFSVDGDGISKVEMVSRVKELCISAYGDDGYAIYLSYNKGKYDVNITSSNEIFNTANNGNRIDEATESFMYVAEDFMMSMAYLIILGIQWLIPSIGVAAVVSLFEYKFRDDKKYIMYLILMVITFILKSFIILNTHLCPYMNSYFQVSSAGRLIICALISGLIFGNGLSVYKEELNDSFIAKFTMDMFIDAALTCMVFVPLMA